MTRDLPGPGDPATWPPYTGHSNDPRGGPDPLEDCEEIDPATTRCPICGGCGWHGEARLADRTHFLSPLESGHQFVVLRDMENRVTGRPADFDMEEVGMEPCPCCDGSGEHPDARCDADGKPAISDPDDGLTGLCANHYEERLRDEAAEARAGI